MPAGPPPLNRFLPLSDKDRTAMLAASNLTEAALFDEIIKASFEDFAALNEREIRQSLVQLAKPLEKQTAGLGIGNYFIPAVVDSIASRGEFVTAYTPYQPECSQGTLGAIFEFQTRICELTGLDVSNAGLYDGSTAVVEAVVMSLAETGRDEVAVARSVSPAIREVLRTHMLGRNVTVHEIPFDDMTGRTKVGTISDRTAAVVIQSPNVFGVIENEIADLFADAKLKGAIPVHIFHPLAVTVTPKPSELGAEIAVAEGQPLGIALSGGGPFLGLIAASSRFVRRLPGRIAGKTVDADGRDAYVLTLQTREQHIRRERATSNICTNQALMALRATVYMAAMGFDGMREEAQRLREAAETASCGKRRFTGEIFNEFVIAGKEGITLDYPELKGFSLHGIAS